jgi:uncharacterized protein
MTFYLIVASLLFVGIGVLFGSHYLLYFSIIHFFSITDKTDARILLVIIAYLSFSFILSSIIAHIRENLFTRAFYFISGFWLGLLVNLILATFVIWTAVLASSLTGYPIDPRPLAISLFILAFAYSIYGIWNALNPRIKNISVTIPGLPTDWKNKKIVQLSDLHIGHIHKNNFLEPIIEKVNSIGPDMIVITGDLFDGMDGNFDPPLKIINRMNPVKGIFFITGNHETFLNTKVVFSALEKTKIRALHDEVLDIDGLKLIGINYPDHGETKDSAEIIEKLRSQFVGKPNILLHHTPVNIDKFKNIGINLMLSGHTHRGQMFPFQIVTKILFKGFDYGLRTIGNFTIYTTSGAGTWGPTMRTGNSPEIVVITLS